MGIVTNAIVSFCRGLQANLPSTAAGIASALNIATGNVIPGMAFYCTDTGNLYVWNGSEMTQVNASSSGGMWGSITGTLSAQTDLESALTTIASSVTSETSRAEAAEALLVPKTTTVNGHALSANVTVSASDITTGTLPAAQLPNPSASTLGGVESIAAASHKYLTSISTGGVPAAAQPALADLSDTPAQNLVVASPNGSSGALSARALVAADIPTLNQNTSGTAANLSGTPALPNGTTATTQAIGNYSTDIATTAFVAKSVQGINAIAYGVTGNGHFNFNAVAYAYTLTQVAVSGSTTTYTGTINLYGTSGAGNKFANYVFTITGFSNSGNNVQITVTSSTATTLVCTTSTQVNETHAGYAAGNTIDITSGNNFTTDATVGQIVFATTLQRSGANGGTNVMVPQGTITAINSSTQIVVSNTSPAIVVGSNGSYCLVWGDDETTALTNAWNATTACQPGGMLVLPAINPQGNGPAVILTQSAQFNYAGNSGTGGSRCGRGAYGGGINATYIVPTPSFNFATADSNKVCFCDVQDGANFHDFTIFGAGNGNPANIYGASLASYIAVQAHSSDNCVFQDMALIAWGAGSAGTYGGIGIGLNVAGGEIIIRRVDMDMFGNVACQAGQQGSLGYQIFDQCTFWDVSDICFLVNPASSGLYNPVYTFGCNMGSAGQIVSVIGGGIWYDFGSQISLSGSGGSANTVLLGYATTSGTVSGQTGTARLVGTQVVCSSPSHLIYIDNSTCSMTAVGCNFNQQYASGSAILLDNNGTFYDGGGNSFVVHSGDTLYSGTGSVFGCGSITGTAQTSGNIALVNFGSSPSVGTVSGNTQLEQFTLTVGSSPSGTATVTVTFPTPFLKAPICNLVQVGGTNPTVTFTPGTITGTSAAFTVNGTLTATDTLVCQLTASLP